MFEGNGSFWLGLRLPWVTCDKNMSVCRIMNISLGSLSFCALAQAGVDIDLVGGVEFLLGPNKNNYKKIIKGLTFCCTHEYICSKDNRNDLYVCGPCKVSGIFFFLVFQVFLPWIISTTYIIFA